MPICHYPAIIEGDEDTGYSVFFPDVPGCTSGGDTLQEAALNAEEALAEPCRVDASRQASGFLPQAAWTICRIRSSLMSPRYRVCS